MALRYAVGDRVWVKCSPKEFHPTKRFRKPLLNPFTPGWGTVRNAHLNKAYGVWDYFITLDGGDSWYFPAEDITDPFLECCEEALADESA